MKSLTITDKKHQWLWNWQVLFEWETHGVLLFDSIVYVWHPNIQICKYVLTTFLIYTKVFQLWTSILPTSVQSHVIWEKIKDGWEIHLSQRGEKPYF